MAANPQSPFDRVILVAIPDDWRFQVQQILEQNGYSAIMATSEDEACTILQEIHLNAAVITSDWAMTHEDGKAGLLQLVRGKIPTVCLVTKSVWLVTQGRWFEELFHPPMHEYCSVPFGANELLTRLKAVISKAETGT